MHLPVMPPVEPMLAAPVAGIPAGRFYEPKWDGFRAIVFRDGDEVEIGSRNGRPMGRYFPERRDRRVSEGRRRELFAELEPLICDVFSFAPLRPQRVVEVRYDHMEGPRVRPPAAVFAQAPGPRSRVLRVRPARASSAVRPRRDPGRRRRQRPENPTPLTTAPGRGYP
jgi:ATP-dependent DNA ligase